MFVSICVAAFAVCVELAAVSAEAVAEQETTLKLKIDEQATAITSKRTFALPGPAKRLFARYERIADTVCPLTLMRSPDKPDKSEKGFAWSVGVDARKTAICFITTNPSDTARPIEFKLETLLPLTPTYYRVYSPDKGRTWKTIAYEPPHASISGCPQTMPDPFRIEVPAYSCQVAVVRMKESGK